MLVGSVPVLLDQVKEPFAFKYLHFLLLLFVFVPFCYCEAFEPHRAAFLSIQNQALVYQQGSSPLFAQSFLYAHLWFFCPFVVKTSNSRGEAGRRGGGAEPSPLATSQQNTHDPRDQAIKHTSSAPNGSHILRILTKSPQWQSQPKPQSPPSVANSSN